jgi:hypothetical protein
VMRASDYNINGRITMHGQSDTAQKVRDSCQ